MAPIMVSSSSATSDPLTRKPGVSPVCPEDYDSNRESATLSQTLSRIQSRLS